MKLVLISDTHGLHNKIKIPQGDILIHAGDCTNIGSEEGIRDFTDWFKNINGFRAKIFVAGNHDWGFQKKPSWLSLYVNDSSLLDSNCFYLEDNEIDIQFPEFSKPLKFYGSPWQPEFCNWAFNLPRDGKEIKSKWDAIPDDTDVLITHCPPYKIMDFVSNRYGEQFCGCSLLRDRILEVKPLINVFGHIHGGYGNAQSNDINYINASTCTEDYDPINKPIVVDLVEVDGKIVIKHG